MTQRDTIQCVHEPFGEAFYFGPERLSSRYEKDSDSSKKKEHAGVTYKSVLDGLGASGVDEASRTPFHVLEMPLIAEPGLIP